MGWEITGHCLPLLAEKVLVTVLVSTAVGSEITDHESLSTTVEWKITGHYRPTAVGWEIAGHYLSIYCCWLKHRWSLFTAVQVEKLTTGHYRL